MTQPVFFIIVNIVPVTKMAKQQLRSIQRDLYCIGLEDTLYHQDESSISLLNTYIGEFISLSADLCVEMVQHKVEAILRRHDIHAKLWVIACHECHCSRSSVTNNVQKTIALL